ncbi:isochorismatase family protein [Pontibacter sp. G13]|uniref:isochorismatase family protein n=1 Tax=Pontibacter sp. G13 TaxID=3074898 RepID=UPI00288A7277|nr:isochorismatase family protein [Pontibacter sp. G13]WNJ16423.1 isochorismatase family protein [Pontibacter sp. G13]
MKKSTIVFTVFAVAIALATFNFTTRSTPTEAKGPGAHFVPKDPKTDNLLTSENTVLLVIDWQEEMLGMVRNMDREVLTNNIQAMIKTADVFDIPVIESTIGVELGANQPTVSNIKEFIPSDVENIDRISLNAWQNQAVVDAVAATGRKKVLITGLWTSGCPTYTALDALQDGYEVYILTDLMGDATTDAHNRAIDRMVQAGAIPFTWEGAGAEILRAYTHPKAMQDEEIEGGFVGIMKEHFYPFAGKY